MVVPRQDPRTRRRYDTRSAIAYCKLDIIRMDSYGKMMSLVADAVAVPLVVLLFNVFGIMTPLMFDAMGVLLGIAVALNVVMPWWFSDMGNHASFDGLVPVSRNHQVDGRYLFLLVNMAIIIFDMVISGVIMALFGTEIAAFEVVFATLYSMLIFALLSAVLVPVLYRFGFGKGIRAIMIGAFAVCLVLGVLMGFAASSADLRRWLNGLLEIIAGVVRAIADSSFPGLGALIAVAVCAAAIAISHQVSRRIWNSHEM